MPRSFLVKKVKSDEDRQPNQYRIRDAFEDSVVSLKAATPFTPALQPLSVRISNGYIQDVVVPTLPQNSATILSDDDLRDRYQERRLQETPSPEPVPENNFEVEVRTSIPGLHTVGYTYDAFFVSDGRSRKNAFGIPTKPQKQRYTCNECGKDYATSSNLSRHKQTHRSLDSHSAKKCPHCDKVYVSMPALSMHILTHELKHKCDICGKAFSRPWLLQGHRRSHTGEKPFGCAHCGKAFADRSNLRAHMQTHSAFKHFKCKRCDKSFALKSYLNKHYESACIKDGTESETGSVISEISALSEVSCNSDC